MTALLRAHSVSLELPLDMQRLESGERLSGFKATLGGSERLYRKVLSDIKFEAREGDRIGLLGLNGAGKTTLLRVLNGAFPPTHGYIERKGNTQSLLNATLGFSEYASVIENVILRGTAMGLRRRQLDAALPDILEFAGLTDRATHRLHTLSTGQRMRLGFSISTAIQPDILLMDEWIATGDAAFINRAQERLRSRFNDSRIVVLASHNTRLLRDMCSQLLVLDQGKVRYFGSVDAGMDVFSELVAREGADVRAQMKHADPLLFGDVLGMLERVRIGRDHVEIEGWAADKKGNAINALTVEVDGKSMVMGDIERVERDDVRRHLGRPSGAYGFRSRFKVDGGPPTTPITQWLAISVSTRKRAAVASPLAFSPNAVIERDAA